MLCRPIWCSTGGIGPEHPTAVALVVFQNRVRLRRQRVMGTGINVDCNHVRPFFEVVLTCRSELVLIVLRPAVEITDASERERGFPFCSGRCVRCNERENKRGKNLERANSHAVAGGGIGGGTPEEIRFRQAARCRIRKISQPTKANNPPGRLTSINQPMTPSE